jgi:DNA recombination protein Rad52
MNITKLNRKLSPTKISKREGTNKMMLSYVAGYVIENEANEIFDYDWSRETLDMDELYKREYKNSKGNDMIEVAYKSRVRVKVGDIIKEGTGFGNGIASVNNPMAAYELALKEAETDAFKRAMKSFGSAFGLDLYDKDLDAVREYNKAMRTDEKFNEALLKISQCSTQAEVADLVKTYTGNYGDEVREYGIKKVADLKA